MSEQKEKKKIVYYPGCAVMFWEPEIGKAAVRILERNGFEVLIPKHQCCGVAKASYGNFKAARRDASKLVDELHKFVKQGYDVLTACPSCNLAIKEEHPFLLKTEKSMEVAEKTYFFSEYLNKLHAKGQLNTSFKQMSLTVAYHAPCHLKAQGLGEESVKLLSLVPGLKVIDIDRGCCGMSGTAGFKRRYYESSMTIGQSVFERVKELNVKLVATDCAGCEMQIGHGVDGGIEVTHPLIILDKAYA
jgi:glycerol-3-phosphate dehydrogenase subunit C